MVKLQNSRNSFKEMLIYFVSFMIVWTFRVILFSQKQGLPVISAFQAETLRIFVWIIPVILVLKYYYKVNPFSFLKMNEKTGKGIALGIGAGIIFGIWIVARDHFIFQKQLNFNIGVEKAATVLVVGFAEEILFRGLILQKLNEQLKFWQANIISSIMFMLSHFPSYLYHANKDIFINGLNLLLMGFIFGILFKKTKTLWTGIISHSVYDLIAFLFI